MISLDVFFFLIPFGKTLTQAFIHSTLHNKLGEWAF